MLCPICKTQMIHHLFAGENNTTNLGYHCFDCYVDIIVEDGKTM